MSHQYGMVKHLTISSLVWHGDAPWLGPISAGHVAWPIVSFVCLCCMGQCRCIMWWLSRGDQSVPPPPRRRQRWWWKRRWIWSFQEVKNHPAKNVSTQKIAYVHSKNVIQRCWYTRTVPAGVLLHWGTCTTPPRVNEGQEAPTGIWCTHFQGMWYPHAVQMTKRFP